MPTAHQTGPLAAQNSVSRRNSNSVRDTGNSACQSPARTGIWAARQSFKPSTSQENKKGNQDLFYSGKILISNAEISLRPNKWAQGEPGIWWENFWDLSEHIWALVHHMEKSPLTHTTNGLNPCKGDVIPAVVSEQSWWSGCAAGKPVQAMEHLLTHQNQPRAKLKQGWQKK